VLLQDVNHEPGFGDLFPGAPPLLGPRRALPGQRVLKVGAGSGITYGLVDAVHVSPVPILEENETIWYEDLFFVIGENGQPFAVNGDGGAIVLDEDGWVLGLVLGYGGDRTVACNIDFVLGGLDCSLVLPASGPASKKRRQRVYRRLT
jgi:hypothetical protein